MALHSWDPVDGLKLWQGWSKTKTYPTPEKECEKKWKAFHAGGKKRRTLQTLMRWATAAGWKGFRDPATILDNGWEALRLGKLRDVDRFPLDVFPDVLQQLCKDVANACNNIDVGMVATHLLTVAGGLMGRSVELWLGESRYASACLFSAVCGGAGASKSAALEYMMLGGRRVEDMLARRVRQPAGRVRGGDGDLHRRQGPEAADPGAREAGQARPEAEPGGQRDDGGRCSASSRRTCGG